jgi:hypothetical protein
VGSFSVVPEEIVNELLIEKYLIIEQDFVLINEFFLDRSIVLLNITIHCGFALEVPCRN